VSKRNLTTRTGFRTTKPTPHLIKTGYLLTSDGSAFPREDRADAEWWQEQLNKAALAKWQQTNKKRCRELAKDLVHILGKELRGENDPVARKHRIKRWFDFVARFRATREEALAEELASATAWCGVVTLGWFRDPVEITLLKAPPLAVKSVKFLFAGQTL